MHQNILFIILVAIALAANAENFEILQSNIWSSEIYAHRVYWLFLFLPMETIQFNKHGAFLGKTHVSRCFKQEHETGYRISFKIPFCQVKQKLGT